VRYEGLKASNSSQERLNGRNCFKVNMLPDPKIEVYLVPKNDLERP
jgi:hypothetical protein